MLVKKIRDREDDQELPVGTAGLIMARATGARLPWPEDGRNSSSADSLEATRCSIEN